jgi:hypothetical protein
MPDLVGLRSHLAHESECVHQDFRLLDLFALQTIDDHPPTIVVVVRFAPVDLSRTGSPVGNQEFRARHHEHMKIGRRREADPVRTFAGSLASIIYVRLSCMTLARYFAGGLPSAFLNMVMNAATDS